MRWSFVGVLFLTVACVVASFFVHAPREFFLLGLLMLCTYCLGRWCLYEVERNYGHEGIVSREQKVREGEQQVINDMHSHVELLFQSDNEQVELAESIRGLRERKWWSGILVMLYRLRLGSMSIVSMVYWLLVGVTFGAGIVAVFRIWVVLLRLWKGLER